MSNTNCLADLACPRCGNDSCLNIEVRTLATFTDLGCEDYGGMDWDYASPAECPECDFTGAVHEFTVTNQPRQPTDQE